ncbi:MAG: methyl-accepting chemotaxis protein [Nitrospirota bacterium]
MQDAQGSRKRRNYFINKELQGKYTFYFFLMVTLGSIAFTMIFSLLAADTMTIVYKDHSLHLGKTPSVLLREILRAHWIFIIIGGIAVSIISVFLTHRFAGPIYRFERSLDEMIRGNLNFEIRLRKHDSGKELASLMNRFIAILASHIAHMRQTSDALRDTLTALAASPAGGTESGELLGRALELNSRLQTTLRSYTIKGDTGLPSPMKKKTTDSSDTAQVLNRTRAFSTKLKDAINRDELLQLTDIIHHHLSHFSPMLPEESRKILNETLNVIEQTKVIDTRLNELLSSYTSNTA